jgi:hypothetical protein
MGSKKAESNEITTGTDPSYNTTLSTLVLANRAYLAPSELLSKGLEAQESLESLTLLPKQDHHIESVSIINKDDLVPITVDCRLMVGRQHSGMSWRS